MAPTVIPPEIWEYIAQFLPSKIRRDLYPVNHVYFNLALNERYREVNIGLNWPDVKEGLRILNHLRQPHIASRVRDLTISADWFNSVIASPPPADVTLVTVLAYYLPFDLGRHIDPSIRRISDLRRVDDLMKCVVPCFPNVSQLTIHGGYPSSQSPESRSLDSGPNTLLLHSWPTFAPTLRKLSIHAECANLKSILPPHPSNFVCLEDVAIHFGSPVDSVLQDADAPFDFEAASTFLRGISSTVCDLTLMFQHTSPVSQDARQLLDSLPRFPRLSSFCLYIPDLRMGSGSSEDDFRNTTPATSFISKNAETLQQLHIQPPIPSHLGRFLKDDPPRLANLETLALLPPDEAEETQLPDFGYLTAEAYIRGSEDTLTSLSLFHTSLSAHDLGKILEVLGGQLKTLQFWIRDFNPALLDLLYEKAQGLEELRVDFAYLKIDEEGSGAREGVGLEDVSQEDIDIFLIALKTRSYPDSRLRSLEVNRVGLYITPRRAMEIMQGIKGCVPTLNRIVAGRGEEMWWDQEKGVWVDGGFLE